MHRPTSEDRSRRLARSGDPRAQELRAPTRRGSGEPSPSPGEAAPRPPHNVLLTPRKREEPCQRRPSRRGRADSSSLSAPAEGGCPGAAAPAGDRTAGPGQPRGPAPPTRRDCARQQPPRRSPHRAHPPLCSPCCARAKWKRTGHAHARFPGTRARARRGRARGGAHAGDAHAGARTAAGWGADRLRPW